MKTHKIILPLLSLLLTGCGNSNASSTIEPSITPSQPENVSSVVEENNDVDVIILAGQSNAEGHTHISELQRNILPNLFTKYLTGLTKTKIKYNCDYGRNKSDDFKQVALGQGFNKSRFGPEVGMAEVFQQTELKRDIYIIKHTIGGTNLYSQWKSPSSGSEGSLYMDFIVDLYESLTILEDLGLNPIVRGVCWMQGESDATNLTYSNAYQEYEKNFFADLTDELSAYIDGESLHIYDALISDCSTWVNYQIINNAKLANAEENEYHHIIDTLAASLSYSKEPISGVDYFHYDSLDMLELGRMFANSILETSIK